MWPHTACTSYMHRLSITNHRVNASECRTSPIAHWTLTAHYTARMYGTCWVDNILHWRDMVAYVHMIIYKTTVYTTLRFNNISAEHCYNQIHTWHRIDKQTDEHSHTFTSWQHSLSPWVTYAHSHACAQVCASSMLRICICWPKHIMVSYMLVYICTRLVYCRANVDTYGCDRRFWKAYTERGEHWHCHNGRSL